MKPKQLRILMTAALCLSSLAAIACQVPVFRYAFERWENDDYRAIVVSKGPLSEKYQTLYSNLEKMTRADDGVANVYIDSIDLDAAADDSLWHPLYKKHQKNGDDPLLLLFYPKSTLNDKPIWSGPLTRTHAKNMLDSPLRKQLIKNIALGYSATWLIIQSGDPVKDAAAKLTVALTSREIEKELPLPEGVITHQDIERASGELDNLGNDPNILRSAIPLKIAFTNISVAIDDPAEEIFLSMLLHIEGDLDEFKTEPKLFPIFGRTRTLEPLIGKGIETENIWAMAEYICGACSCEVKRQNPGIDLLSNIDWYDLLEGSEIVLDKLLPELTGSSDLLKKAATPSNAAPVTARTDSQITFSSDTHPSRLGRNVALAGASIVLILVIATVVMRRKET